MDNPELEKIHDERILAYFSRSVWNTEIAVLGVIAAITMVLFVQVQTTAVWWWLAQALVVQIPRLYLAHKIVDTEKVNTKTRLNLAVLLAIIGGLSMASVMFFSPLMTLETCALISMILVGTAAGSIATCHGYRAIYLAFVVPIFVGILAIWGFGGVNEISMLFSVMVALLTIQLGVLFYSLSRRVYNTYCEGLITQDKLERALRSEQMANSAKTRFLAAASHDLRQPLHAMALFSAALSMRPLDEKSQTIATKMNEAMQALTSELDSLLDISKLDAGIVSVEQTTIDLSGLVRRLAELFELQAEEKNVRLNIHVAEHLFAHTDPKLLERILRNVLDNAVKYTYEGAVTCALESKQGRAVISVTDTGVGIEPAEQLHIWEEFYQVGNSARDRQQGLGLGLSVVSRLAKILNITVDVESKLGEGTAIQLTLPVEIPSFLDTEIRRDDFTMAELEKLNNRHVLVVDDDEGVQLGTESLLKGLGMTVTSAANEASALQKFRTHPVDVVLMDLRLADGDDGFETVQKLRSVKQDIPVIVISGDTGPDRLKKASSFGCAWLVKPVKTELLIAELNRIFE